MTKQLQLILIGILFPVLMNAQWTSQATGFTTPNRGIFDISITDANTVWGIAYNGNIDVFSSVPEFTKTTNGGTLFTPGAFPAGWVWSNISALDGTTAWISVIDVATGYDGAIFKTTDGGTTWNEQGVGTIFNNTSYVDFVYFWNANEGVTMGDPNPTEFEIYTTNDGGTTWTPIPGSAIPNPLGGEFGISNYFCTFDNDIWFSTNKARVYHSSDKGLTWTVSNTGIFASDGINIAFWNANEGIARQYNYFSNINTEVRKTSDGGATWIPAPVSGTFFGSTYSGLTYVPGTISTLVSTGESMNSAGSSYSNDGGNTWILMDTLVQHYVARFLNNTTGWCGGYNTSNVADGIFKYSGAPLGIYNPENGKEIYFNIYPNPSEGTVTVHLANAGNDDLKISVLDISGRKVFENNFGKPGEFFMRSIDLSSLSKGVYFLEIENGNLNHSEKIVLR